MARTNCKARKKARAEANAKRESGSACTRVFRTAELGEAIFMHLPMYEILVNVQRTSKQWKAVVECSGPLQESLFLKSVTKRPLVHKPELEGGNPEDHVLLNPFIAFTQYSGQKYHGARWTPRGALLLHSPIDWSAANLRSEASWRRQLLTQPPLKSLELIVCFYQRDLDWPGLFFQDRNHDESLEKSVIQARPGAAGITLQDVVDQCKSYGSWDGPPRNVGYDRVSPFNWNERHYIKVTLTCTPTFQDLQEVKRIRYNGPWVFKD